jgi:site-specific DNA recombinase
MNKLAILCARVSTDTQAGRGYSLGSQIEGMLSYAAQHGMSIADDPANQWDKSTLLRVFKVPDHEAATLLQTVNGKAVYFDDISGSVPMRRRPGGKRVYEWIDRRQAAFETRKPVHGTADSVLFHCVDRATRDEDVIEILEIRRDVRNAGMELHYALDGKADLSLDGAPMDFFRGWGAAKQNERHAENVRRGILTKAQRGLVVGMGGAPYGYHYRDGQLIVHEPEAEIVRNVFDWYVVGDEHGRRLKAPAIARRLSREGAHTPSERNNRRRLRAKGIWTTNAVTNMLKNETYCGVWRFGRWIVRKGKRIAERPINERIAISVPPVVTRDLWHAAQDTRDHNRKMSARNNKRHDYLLRGRFRCERCGSAMTGRFVNNATKSGRCYYACSSAANRHSGLEELCTQPGIRTAEADALVWSFVLEALKGDDFEQLLRDAQAEDLAALNAKRDRLTQIDERIEQLEAEAANIAASMAQVQAGGVVQRALQSRAEDVERRYADACRERDDLAHELNAKTLSDEQIAAALQFREDVCDGLENPTFEDKRDMLEALDVRVFVDGYQMRVTCAIEIEPRDLSIGLCIHKTTSNACWSRSASSSSRSSRCWSKTDWARRVSSSTWPTVRRSASIPISCTTRPRIT